MGAKSLLAAVVSGLLVAGCGHAPWEDGAEVLFLLPGETHTFSTSRLPETPEWAAVMAAVHSGTALPPGLEITYHDWSRTKLHRTDEVVPGTHERIWVLTIEEEPGDLVRAGVWIDGQLVQTASRADVVERGGIATAELCFAVPPKGQAYDLKIAWSGEDGLEASSECTVPGLRPPWSRLLGWMWR